MIKSDYGKVELKGNRALLAAEFVSIVSSFFHNKMFNKRDFKKFIKEGFKNADNVESYYGQNENQKLFREVFKSINGKKAQKADEIKCETLLDNKNVKITKINMNANGKSKTEIEEILKDIFKKEGFLDE